MSPSLASLFSTARPQTCWCFEFVKQTEKLMTFIKFYRALRDVRYKALCNYIITIYMYILIQWEIWCDASIWLLMVVHSSEVSQDFPRWTDCPLHWAKAGPLSYLFIVIISLSDWPSSLVSATTSNSQSEMVSVDLIFVICATPSSSVLTSRNIKVSLKVLFCPGAPREGERNV